MTPPVKHNVPDYLSPADMNELVDARQLIRDGILARQLSRNSTPLTAEEKLARTRQIIQDRILASCIRQE